MTLEKVLDDICAPAYSRWKEFCARIIHGEITLTEVERYLRTYNENQLLKDELHAMSPGQNVGWIDTTMQQINKYYYISQLVDTATTVMNVKDLLCLTGDFSDITSVLRMVCTIFLFNNA